MSKLLKDKHIVLGITGGIAAYKSAELIRCFTESHAHVRVAMTKNACEFIGPMTLQALTGQPVATDMMSLTEESLIGHIAIADQADVIVIAPATANCIAKLAAGLSDDIITTMVLAAQVPVVIAPAMNANMWNNAAVQHNVQTLRTRGFHIVDPDCGFLACGWTGEGRLAKLSSIEQSVVAALLPNDLEGETILVTAGATREPLDPMRFLSNASTGQMGFAIAKAALQRGATVHLIVAHTSAEPPVGAHVHTVSTTEQMNQTVHSLFSEMSVVVMAAAVSDFRPTDISENKIKKNNMHSVIEITANPDILASLGAHRGTKKQPVLIGFAAETENLQSFATAKLKEKQCDLIVANNIAEKDIGFASHDNRVTFIDGIHEPEHSLTMSKEEIGHLVIDKAISFL